MTQFGQTRIYFESLCLSILQTQYIAVQYNTLLHTVQQLRRLNVGHTSKSRMIPIPCPHGRAMGVIRELL